MQKRARAMREGRDDVAQNPVYLVAVAYDEEFKADEARILVKRAQREGIADVLETAVVAVGPDGKKRLTQDVDLEGRRRMEGHWLGIAAALVTGVPPLIFVGTAAGEIVGRLTDRGIHTSDLRRVGHRLTPGTSALFVLTHEAVPRGALANRLQPLGGHVVHATLSPETTDELDRLLKEPALP